MIRPDLTNLTPKQDRVLCDAFRYLRQRAAWLRAQKEATVKQEDADIGTTAENIEPMVRHQ